jgi:hypothetical protein
MTGDENRAWKATRLSSPKSAPTTKTTLKALKLTRMRAGGNPDESENSTFYETIDIGILNLLFDSFDLEALDRLAQGGASFDFAQDREPVERLVEPFVIWEL